MLRCARNDAAEGGVAPSPNPLPLKGARARTEKRFGRSEYAGTGRLYINDRLVSEGRLDHVANPYMGMSSLTVGRAANSPVSKDYSLPFTYGGQIDKVEVELR